MSLNVCVECGTRVRRLVRKLQFDNYCLEKCPECKNDSDKYLEYERNLKILNIILCFPQIYRHIFFNLDSIKKNQISLHGVFDIHHLNTILA